MLRDALIVGINQYKYLPNLSAPAQDAEAVSRHLVRWGEFQVHRLPETIQNSQPMISQRSGVTVRDLEQALVQLFKPSGQNVPQTALFYYSGHGLQRHAGIQEGYLATSDSQPEQGRYGLSLFWLRRLLQDSPVRQRVVILDCCHSGELLNFLEADPGASQGTDRLFMAASREYEAAYESLDSPHSVFTQALLQGLKPHGVEGGIVNQHHLIKTVSQQLQGNIQQPLFESSGSSIVLTRSTGVLKGIHAPAPSLLERLQQLKYAFCPFRGLAPFEEEHAAYFFGREALTAELVHHVRHARICTLTGASGSGKTSLLKAGLMHQLRRSLGPVSWPVHYLTPAQQPLQRLAALFACPQAASIERAEQIYQAEVFLTANPGGLSVLAQTALAAQAGPTAERMVIIIDQLETLWQAGISQSERQQFCRCLEAALKRPDLPIHFVFGLRSDGLSLLREFPELFSYASEHRIDLPPMSYEQIKSTIVKPLDKVGLAYDANLIYTLLLDTVGAPGELSLLQPLLRQLWLQRQFQPNRHAPPGLTLDAYAAMGGVRAYLNRRATQFYQALPPEQQLVAQQIFLQLSEPGEGTEDRRRRVNRQQLVTDTLSQPRVDSLLQQLAQARLVVLDQAAARGDWQPSQPSSGAPPLPQVEALSEVSVDIAHESLIRTWPPLRQWLADYRPVLVRQRRIEAATLEWQRHGCPHRWEYLLRGHLLQSALEFQQRQGSWLSTQAQQYIQHSLQQARRQRLQQWALRCLVPLSLGAGMVSAYGYYRLSQFPLTATTIAPQDSSLPLPSRSASYPQPVHRFTQGSQQVRSHPKLFVTSRPRRSAHRPQFTSLGTLVPPLYNATRDVLNIARQLDQAGWVEVESPTTPGPIPQ